LRKPFALLPVALVCGFFACGDRTGLLVPEPSVDAAADRGPDVAPEREAAVPVEAGVDVEAEADALPLIDVSFPDVPLVSSCPDAGSTLIYVLTESNDLYSFYPPTLTFTRIGTIACPTTGGGTPTPFSMAVNRAGIAYTVFSDGELFRVDTASAACEATGYPPDQEGFSTFGMGYVANTADAGETLFVAEADAVTGKPSSMGLASIDTTSLALSFVGPFVPPIPGPELTGTADGSLFAFYTNAVGSGSHIVEVDRLTGQIVADSPLQVGSPEDAYAFGFWGGVFWVFTSDSPGPAGISQVTRFDPQTGQETNPTTMPEVIVGAGVSTCAPQ
jgi:hypothetical protein